MSSAVKMIITHCKKTPAVIPLLMITCVGAVGATSYLIRLAVATPDGAGLINREREPFNRYENKNYKFWTYFDAENYKHPRPRFD